MIRPSHISIKQNRLPELRRHAFSVVMPVLQNNISPESWIALTYDVQETIVGSPDLVTTTEAGNLVIKESGH